MALGLDYLRRTTIRTRLLTVAVAMVLLPAIAITVTYILVNTRGARQNAIARLESVAALKQAEIDRWVGARHTELQVLLSAPDTAPHISALMNADGASATTRPQARDLVEQHLGHFIRSAQRFGAMWLMDRRGQVVWSSDPADTGRSRAQETYFREGLRQPHTYLDPPPEGPDAAQEQEGSVLVVRPVVDAQGQTLGVIAAQANAGWFNRIMQERAGLGETGETYLVDEDGRLLTDSRFAGYVRGRARVQTRGANAALLEHRDGAGIYPDYRGVPAIGVYRWLADLNVALLVEQDRDEWFAPVYTATRISLLVSLAAVASAVLVSGLVTRSIVRPLGELAGTARRIAAGDGELLARVHRSDEDEVGILARSFNEMTLRLRETGQSLATTLNSIGDAVIATDRLGRVERMNPVAESLTGWRLDEARGRELAEVYRLMCQKTRTICPDPARRVLEQGTVVVLPQDALLVSRDGSERPIADSAAPIRDRSGAISGVVVVFHDVTEARRMEREREQLLDKAQGAQAEAEAANRAKDEFLALLSHELRTPLTAMLGWIQMLRKGLLAQDETPRALEIIERNAWEQSQIVKDLLDVSAIIQGKVRLETRPVDLRGVVEAVLDSLSLAAQAKQIQLTRQLDGGTGAVCGDASRLQQVMWNMLSNAIKFTPEGGWITVRLVQEASLVRLQLRDSGIGIAPDFLPHVFDRFRQADSSRTRRYGGLGIGLAIVRHLVEMHGGTVHAASEGVGKGATFTVELPLMTPAGRALRPAEATPWRAGAPGSGDGDGQRLLDGRRILVVDDEPDTRELLRRVLKGRGAQIATAGSAQEALELVRTWQPHVLLSDIAMPGEDGYELIRQVRRLAPEQGGRLPAAALTAMAGAEDSALALAAGFQMHVAKPVDAAELVATVARLAGSDGSPAATGAAAPFLST